MAIVQARAARRLLAVHVALGAMTGCGWFDPEPLPPVVPAAAPAPANVPVADATPHRSPLASPELQPGEAHALDVLRATVERYGLDADNPWAVGHALLALGPDAKLPDGTSALDTLFSRYAQAVAVGPSTVLRFPREADGKVVEPHTALVLKAVTDIGVPPTRMVTVQGASHPLAELYQGTLDAMWVDGPRVSVFSWNDTPWALQGLATWSAPGMSWTTSDGHGMDLDRFTHALVSKLVDETAFMTQARSQGVEFVKRGQGIFAYTCGGAHLLQGVATAVARGFGAPEDRAAVIEQGRLSMWRFPRELTIVDDALARAPEYAQILRIQRLKFVGHHLETMQRFAALGLLPPDDAELLASVQLARTELVASVAALETEGAFGDMAAVRARREQSYLDMIGDSAHALHGLELATGAASVWW